MPTQSGSSWQCGNENETASMCMLHFTAVDVYGYADFKYFMYCQLI